MNIYIYGKLRLEKNYWKIYSLLLSKRLDLLAHIEKIESDFHFLLIFLFLHFIHYASTHNSYIYTYIHCYPVSTNCNHFPICTEQNFET